MFLILMFLSLLFSLCKNQLKNKEKKILFMLSLVTIKIFLQGDKTWRSNSQTTENFKMTF